MRCMSHFMNRLDVDRASACRVLCAVAALSILGACGSKEETKVVTPAAPVKHVEKPVDPTAGMALAPTVDQSHVPVDLKYDIASKPVAGTPVEVKLAVIASSGADSMGVAFKGSPGLTLSEDAVPNIDNVKSGKIDYVTFSATAADPDVFYVTVTVSMYSAGVSSSREFVVPIIFSNPEPDKETTAEAHSNAEPVPAGPPKP